MTLPAVSIPAKARSTIEVHCAEGRSLSVAIEDKRAIVTFEGRRLILPRRAFRFGNYYRSESGALVIDGRFVAFVPAGDTSWRECETEPSSKARARP